MTQAIALADFVFQSDDVVKTTSLKVAEAFEKEHKNVLKKLDEICTQVPDLFKKLNFKPLEIEQKANLGNGVYKTRAYELTKDGFMLLVMGFTGKKAMQTKIAFIEAFNWMAGQLGLAKSQSRLSTKADRVPLKDAVNMLVAKTANLNYAEAYKLVHQKMAIESVKELTTDQIPAAVEYVHGLVVQAVTIHGELLLRAEEAPPHIVMIPIDTRKDGQHLIVVSGGLVGKYRPMLTSDASDYDKPWGTLLKAEFAAQ